jgi:hypothetical protein
MILAHRVRRAFADDGYIFQCGMCGTNKTVKRSSKPGR